MDVTDAVDVEDVEDKVAIADGVEIALVLGDGTELVVWIGRDVWLEPEPSSTSDGLLEVDAETWPDVIIGDGGAVELADDCDCPHCNSPLLFLHISPSEN